MKLNYHEWALLLFGSALPAYFIALWLFPNAQHILVNGYILTIVLLSPIAMVIVGAKVILLNRKNVKARKN